MSTSEEAEEAGTTSSSKTTSTMPPATSTTEMPAEGTPYAKPPKTTTPTSTKAPRRNTTTTPPSTTTTTWKPTTPAEATTVRSAPAKPGLYCHDKWKTRTCEAYDRRLHCCRARWCMPNCRKTCGHCPTAFPPTTTARPTASTRPPYRPDCNDVDRRCNFYKKFRGCCQRKSCADRCLRTCNVCTYLRPKPPKPMRPMEMAPTSTTVIPKTTTTTVTMSTTTTTMPTTSTRPPYRPDCNDLERRCKFYKKYRGCCQSKQCADRCLRTCNVCTYLQPKPTRPMKPMEMGPASTTAIPLTTTTTTTPTTTTMTTTPTTTITTTITTTPTTIKTTTTTPTTTTSSHPPSTTTPYQPPAQPCNDLFGGRTCQDYQRWYDCCNRSWCIRRCRRTCNACPGAPRQTTTPTTTTTTTTATTTTTTITTTTTTKPSTRPPYRPPVQRCFDAYGAGYCWTSQRWRNCCRRSSCARGCRRTCGRCGGYYGRPWG